MRQQCPTFFNEADNLRFKAYQLLQQAKANPHNPQRREWLEKSLQVNFMLQNKWAPEMFESVAESIQLQPICAEYQSLGFYPGIARLALSHAKAVDPSNLALNWHNAGRPQHDTAGKAAFEQRIQSYSCILDAFTQLDHEHPVQGSCIVLEILVPRNRWHGSHGTQIWGRNYHWNHQLS